MQRREKYGQDLDTGVSILLDNSASMSNEEKIALAFVTGDRLSFWLNSAGVPTEILGFTTAGMQERKRAHHIVYKSFQEQHRPPVTGAMAAMLQDGLRMNNIDGEAVSWAHNRLIQSPYARKILVVVSDGKPSAFRGALLKRHPTDTVSWIERKSPVELIGIGIKTDVGNYYSNAIRIESPYELIETMAERLKAVIDNPRESQMRLKRPPRMLSF